MRKKTCIAVDLTPVLPGGENGGAKLVTIELVRSIARIAPDHKFVLLTSGKSHEELSFLDGANVRRLCVSPQSAGEGKHSFAEQIRSLVQRKLEPLLPASVLIGIQAAYRVLFEKAAPGGSLLRSVGADLLFCPFTAPNFHDPLVPVVSIVYDLQHRFYPQFFSPMEYQARELHFAKTCRHAKRLVCISEYVKGTVLENFKLEPERVDAIHIQLPDRLKKPTSETISALLERQVLEEGCYLLYPANFWPHKNHRMLLTALGIYLSRHPESPLHLVCTGTLEDQMNALKSAAAAMGLGSRVVFPGYLTDSEFAGLLAACRALIFPSLYEGFGMPVLEAMAFDKPVLCSNVTSLPEVGADAVLYFDPRNPLEMVDAIERLEEEKGLASNLVERGRQRLAAFGNAESMALQYLRVFKDVMQEPAMKGYSLHGVYPDGWTGDRVTLTYGAPSSPGHLETLFHAPAWLPREELRLRVCDRKGLLRGYRIKRGESMELEFVLNEAGGILDFYVLPTFRPKAQGTSEDERSLGCLCKGFAIVSGDERLDLLHGGSGSVQTGLITPYEPAKEVQE
jgi:glycosyltransferase involved in cell wall biosynthesis